MSSGKRRDSLTVFQSGPLVWIDQGNIYPLKSPDFVKEKRELVAAVEEGSRSCRWRD